MVFVVVWCCWFIVVGLVAVGVIVVVGGVIVVL